MRTKYQPHFILGLFTFNFIAPYRKENTYNVEDSLLDKVSCQSMSDLQISISFKKLRSFWIQICKAYFSKPLFRGRKFDLKFCTFLRYPKRVHSAFQVILFRSNGLINYRKIEYFWYTLISFGITPNFRSNLRPLNIDLEKKCFAYLNSEWSQLFKTVRNLKIRQTLANEQP